jgi:hypothetical protein
MRDTYFPQISLQKVGRRLDQYSQYFSHLGASRYKISINNNMRNLIHPTLLPSSNLPRVPVLRQGGVALGTEEEAMA